MSLSTPQEVIARLTDIEDHLATNQNALESAAFSYFSLKRERDIARAKALLAQQGGTVAEREAKALIEVASGDIWEQFVSAEAAYEGLRLAQKSLSDRAMIGMSILRSQSRDGSYTPTGETYGSRAA